MDKTEQQRQYRKSLKQRGYKRLELIAHKDDHAEIRLIAERAEKRRQREAKG